MTPRPLYRADPDRLLRVLAESQFDDPFLAFRELYANALDATLGRRDASIRVELGPDRVVLEDSGPGLDAEALEALTTLGGSTRRGEAASIGRFGIGFVSVFAPELGVAQVLFHAHRVGRGEAPGIEVEFLPDAGGGVAIRSRPGSPPKGCGSRITVVFDGERAPADRVERVRACLRRHAAFSGVPTWLDGQQLGRSAEALLDEELDRTEVKGSARTLARACRVERALGIASLDPGRTEACFRVFQRGVFVAEVELPRPMGCPWPRGVFGFARVDGLRLVTSRDAFVEDEAYERALEELQGLVFEVGYAVLRHYESSRDRFARVVLLDALRRGLRTASPELLVAQAHDIFSSGLVRSPLFTAWNDRRTRSFEDLIELSAEGRFEALPHRPLRSEGKVVLRSEDGVEREIFRKLSGRMPMPAAARSEPAPRIGWWSRLQDRLLSGPRAELSLFARDPTERQLSPEANRLVQAIEGLLHTPPVRSAVEQHLPARLPRLRCGFSESAFAPVAAHYAGEIRFNVAHRLVRKLCAHEDPERAARAMLPVLAHELAHVCHDVHDDDFYRTARVLLRTLVTATAELDSSETRG